MFKDKFLGVIDVFLSGILVRSFPMKMNSLSSYPQSFQILTVEIDNSPMFMSRDFTK
jgi:hypothetical protein